MAAVVLATDSSYSYAGLASATVPPPAYEYEESVAKTTAAMRAIELACEQPEWP